MSETRSGRGEPSDHFDGKTFFLPGAPYPRTLLDVWKWQRTSTRATWPATVACRSRDRPPARVEGSALRVAMVGHATALIQTQGLNILCDPVWSERVSPFRVIGPKRVCPPGIDFDHLPPIDLVLVTHNHYDHLDLDTLRRLENAFHPQFVTPLGNDGLIRKAGRDARVAVLDWGESLVVPNGLRVHLEPCQHWSARGIFDRNEMLWGAFVLETAGGNLYIAGDTGLGDGSFLRRAGERFGPFRFALLPIGAYEPRWFMAYAHMNPKESVEAFGILRVEQAMGYHWGVFQLTDEARDAPREALAVALAEAGIAPERFTASEPGQVWEASP